LLRKEGRLHFFGFRESLEIEDLQKHIMKRNTEKQVRVNMLWTGSGLHRHLTGPRWRRVKKNVATISAIFFFLLLLVCVLLFVGWIDAVSLFQPYFHHIYIYMPTYPKLPFNISVFFFFFFFFLIKKN